MTRFLRLLHAALWTAPTLHSAGRDLLIALTVVAAIIIWSAM